MINEKEFENFWSTAQTDTQVQAVARKRDPVPTGTYNCWVEKAQLDFTATPPKVTLWYKIEEGEHEARILFANYSLNETGTAMLKKSLLKFGAPEKLTLNQLGEFLNTLYGKKCEVYAKHRTYTKQDGTQGDAHNVYVNSVLKVEPAFGDVPALDANETVPF